MTEIQMNQTNKIEIVDIAPVSVIAAFEIWVCFGFRYSIFEFMNVCQ